MRRDKKETETWIDGKQKRGHRDGSSENMKRGKEERKRNRVAVER